MPSTTVSARPHFRPLRSLCSSAWCAQVTVVPDSSRISVLTSGRPQGSKVPWKLALGLGGQVTAGERVALHHADHLLVASVAPSGLVTSSGWTPAGNSEASK